MPSRLLKLSAIAAVALAGTAYTFGGWAVVTVEDLPEYIVAGKPVEVVFTVRQHGMSLMDNLKPVVTAKDGRSDVQASAIPAKGLGRYSATLVVPRTGNWGITINTGFLESRTTLAAIPAIAAGAAPPKALAAADRGERLFIAKGCVACHVHGAVEGSGWIKAGPDLTPKRYQAEYLARYLADPSIAITPGAQNRMPKLDLKPTEVAAITSFINAERRVSDRR